jgi:hypothetical protein
MSRAAIRFKKPIYKVSNALRGYLAATGREIAMPITYQDLLHTTNTITLFDSQGNDTLWETVMYSSADIKFIHEALRQVYAYLKVGGDASVIDHLYIDRVDYCLYANTHPFRVRIVNKLNDLFDYFYIKRADASRVYGMELEHLLSPNKINYLVKGNTFVEEHIQGIPGDTFIKKYLNKGKCKSDGECANVRECFVPVLINLQNSLTNFNPLRIAKEFVKFNERSLVQLVGDMRNDNFVVEIIPDFDELYFRLRAIDFDQQSYEGNYAVYMPQFFKENNPIINLGLKSMTPVLELQYQKEERMRLLTRVKSIQGQLTSLLDAMASDELSTPDNTMQLENELAELYQDDSFKNCNSMGSIVKNSLLMLEKYPVRKRVKVKAVA